MTEVNTRTVEKKSGNKWEAVDRWTNDGEVYDMLAHDIIAKKIEGCTWIKSIKRRQNYNGTKTITVTYRDDVRAVYLITDH